ncbi:MAG: L-lactate dehydrogenase [Pseudomonadales bacterium]|nr:L-lactate dehydrogenase [Pseudomonadales bacterium]
MAPVVTCVEDLKQLHRKRVPKMFYDYAESGSWSEGTFQRNEQAYSEIELRQRVAVDISTRSIRSEMLGEACAMPVGLAPTGLMGMQHADGELHAARAAENFGVPFILSTMSICSIEQVAQAVSKPFWFQLYVMKDRDYIARLIQRAKDANCSALVVTLDLHILGQRHRDLRNGLTAPPRLTLKNLVNMALHPRWCVGMLGTKNHQFGNIIGHAKGVENLKSLSAWSAEQLDPSLSWADLAWVRSLWPGKLVLKGIMDPVDARHAVDAGADAIIVSNHGGRQLDGASATIDVLPEIAAAVAGDVEVFVDGGIRSGQSVFKAMAAGADGTFIGKAFLNGLGADGERGVAQCFDLISRELDLTMAFCGHTDINEVDSAVLIRRDS